MLLYTCVTVCTQLKGQTCGLHDTSNSYLTVIVVHEMQGQCITNSQSLSDDYFVGP